jgi:hypothetical protein
MMKIITGQYKEIIKTDLPETPRKIQPVCPPGLQGAGLLKKSSNRKVRKV